MSRVPAIEGLYIITPDCSDDHDLLNRTRLALQGGAQVLQYRNKCAGAVQQLRQASALRELTREFGATFIINDDARLAVQTEADGVHLGAGDGEIAKARELLGTDKLIGVSCYNRAELAREAAAAGADYVAFGAFFPSTVKPNAVRAEIQLLREMRTDLKLPVVAIGGITAANGSTLIESGADVLAVISAVFGATDVTAAAQELSKLFGRTQAYDFA